MSVVIRWKGRLHARRQLLETAKAKTSYWRARWRTAAKGSQERSRAYRMLVATKELLSKRREQVAEAERVIARHTEVSGISDRGVKFVASFEGFRSHPYRDAAGVWTIGYGETRGIGSHTAPWSQAYAQKQLRKRLDHDFLAPTLELCERVGLDLSQHEADALGSFAYNLGAGIFSADTSIGSALRSKSRRRIADAMPLYNKAGGRVQAGLTRRRHAERRMFLHGSYRTD